MVEELNLNPPPLLDQLLNRLTATSWQKPPSTTCYGLASIPYLNLNFYYSIDKKTTKKKTSGDFYYTQRFLLQSKAYCALFVPQYKSLVNKESPK